MKFSNQVYKGEPINLDDNHFEKCKFIECEIIFNGTGKVSLFENEFRDCKWTFSGAASNTVAFMKAIYAMGGGGKKLIIATFNEIAPDLVTRH